MRSAPRCTLMPVNDHNVFRHSGSDMDRYPRMLAKLKINRL